VKEEIKNGDMAEIENKLKESNLNFMIKSLEKNYRQVVVVVEL
jgi:hypothetical protein